jgi:hypothetical protein
VCALHGTTLALNLKGRGNRSPKSEGPLWHPRSISVTFWIQVKSLLLLCQYIWSQILKGGLPFKCRFTSILVKTHSWVLNKYSIFHWKHKSIALY